MVSHIHSLHTLVGPWYLCKGPASPVMSKWHFVYKFNERMKQNYLSGYEKKKYHESEPPEKQSGKLVFSPFTQV